MSSNGSMPGTGDWVVNGDGPASLREPVSTACNVDLPEFGGPTRQTCAAPSRRSALAWLRPPLRGAASSSVSSRMRDLMSAWRCSVPLCFGIVRSISRRHSRRSRGSRARLYACSASLYSGERFAGMAASVAPPMALQPLRPVSAWPQRRALPVPLGPARSVQRAREGAAAQDVVRLRLVLHEVRDRERDLVVDVVVLRFELGKDADFGDEQIGIRNARLVEVARQHRAVLDRETMQRGAARKERADLRFDVCFEADEEAVGKDGLEIEGLHL